MKKIGIRKILMFGTAGCCLIGAAGAKAQTCTPAPDCESLGYDQSVCPGGFLRCPFDADKLVLHSGMQFDNYGRTMCGGVQKSGKTFLYPGGCDLLFGMWR